VEHLLVCSVHPSAFVYARNNSRITGQIFMKCDAEESDEELSSHFNFHLALENFNQQFT
jgi:hypothetical protein